MSKKLKCWIKLDHLSGYYREDERGLVLIERDNPKGTLIPEPHEKLKVVVSENKRRKILRRGLTKKQAENLMESYMKKHNVC